MFERELLSKLRVWSGSYYVQEAETPVPKNKPYTLINVPFYYLNHIDEQSQVFTIKTANYKVSLIYISFTNV